MPTVAVERHIAAPLEKVYTLAKEVERFPEFMPDLQSVEVLSEDGARRVSRWVGIIRPLGRKIEWTEEDEWDDAAHACQFRQVSGDYDRYEGTWTFEEDGAGTMVKLNIEVEIVVPLIGPLIRGLIARLVEENATAMLEALKKRAEG